MSKIFTGNSGDIVIKTEDEVIKIAGKDNEAFLAQKNFLLENHKYFIKITDVNYNSYGMNFIDRSFIDYILSVPKEIAIKKFEELLDIVDSWKAIFEYQNMYFDKSCYFKKLKNRGFEISGNENDLFREMVSENKINADFTHGDLTFSNILIDKNDNFVFIDPRGKEKVNIYYDYGKIFQSLYYNYECLLDQSLDENKIKDLYKDFYRILLNRCDFNMLNFFLGIHSLGAYPFLLSKNRSYAESFLSNGKNIMSNFGFEFNYKGK